MKEEYDWVTQNFDKVLAEHGYVREGHYYRAEKANEDTLVFFCHFGVSCVLISYLLSISPLVMLQNFCAAPSSVSTRTAMSSTASTVRRAVLKGWRRGRRMRPT